MERQNTSSTRAPAVFFDRDGVLNVDHGYVGSVARFDWIPGAQRALRLCSSLGFRTVLVTNQSGVARGLFDESAVQHLHAWMQEELVREGAPLDAIYYCPHLPDAPVPRYALVCDCRKPRAGMIRRAIEELRLDARRSYLIGDSERDLSAAKEAGVEGRLFTGGNLYDFCVRWLIPG